MHEYVRLGDDVRDALAAGRAVVALESTLITHGLPRPLNAETALAMESEVRAGGAVPATVAVLGGALRVGLTEAEIERIAEAVDVLKVSSRGLGYALATGRTAATTVSGTMWAAKVAGLRVFATGGIGGVHRGAERSGDVSTDLLELSRTQVAVVCAGVKSILDIGRTLEYLETAGVPVLGLGTGEFPAFLTPYSGYKAPFPVATAREVAAVLRAHRRLGLPGGVLVAVPPPASGADAEAIERATARAVREAEEGGISGGEVTPFLLRRVAELTDDVSLRANVALLRNNARAAADIAVAEVTA